MVLAFTEEQAIRIREYGMSVIQYKYCIKNEISIAHYNLRQCIIAINSAFELLNRQIDRFRDVVNNI